MRRVTIVVFVYIHNVILCSTGKIPFTFDQTKTVHFLDNKKLKEKILDDKNKKSAKIRRE